MKIGFSTNYNGPGGARSWIKGFSNYCIENGHSVNFGPDIDIDVFCSVANLSTEQELENIKNNNIKILQRLGAIYLDYNHPNKLLIDNKNNELKKLISYSDSIVYQSKFSKETLFRSIYSGNEPNGDIIYNSADSNLFSPIGSKLDRTKNKKIILAAAYWGTPHTATKSLNILMSIIEHYKKFPEIEFWVLGLAYDGNDRLFRAKNFNNLGKFDILSPVSHNDMPTLIRSVDLVLHLKAHEGCSNMVIETMCSGTPLVGINSGSLPELVSDSALLANCAGDITKFPKVNISNLIAKIDATLSSYTLYHEKLLNRAQNFTPNFTYDLYLKKLIELSKF